MKKQSIISIAAAICPFLAGSWVSAAVIQTLSGSHSSGLDVGPTLIGTANDTNDWITDLTGGAPFFLGWDWTIDNNAGETGSGGFYGGLGIYDGTTERLLLGNGWTQLTYSGGASSIWNDSGISYGVGETVHLVAELTVVDGGTSNDTWKLWVNPGPGDFATPDATLTTWTIDDLTQITNRAGMGTGAATVSDLVVANDFVSVVPEPATASLLLLGGALALRRRRH